MFCINLCPSYSSDDFSSIESMSLLKSIHWFYVQSWKVNFHSIFVALVIFFNILNYFVFCFFLTDDIALTFPIKQPSFLQRKALVVHCSEYNNFEVRIMICLTMLSLDVDYSCWKSANNSRTSCIIRWCVTSWLCPMKKTSQNVTIHIKWWHR